MSVAVPPLRIVQISDLHLKAQPSQLWGADVDAGLQAVLTHIQARQPAPDLILATGDLVGDEPEAYLRLHPCLERLGVPVYCLPGNHDFPGALSQALHWGRVRRSRYVQMGNWQLVLLDSSFPGTAVGHLASGELALLDTVLATEPKRPTLVALHHHPVPIPGMDWMNTMIVSNHAALWAVLERYTQVRAVVFGHIHAEFSGQRGAVQVLAAPATSMQFHPQTPEPQVDDQPPGYRWLTLYPDGHLETGIERVRLDDRSSV